MTEPSSNDTLTKTPDEPTPVLTLINKIKIGEVQPKTIGADDRRRCVEVLHSEGLTQAEIGQILSVSERTIHRDIERNRQDHALSPDPEFPERMVGELCQQADVSIARLRRIAREAGPSAMERLMAETSAWKVYRELFEKLQSVGYLPRVPQSVVTEVYQHFEADPVESYENLSEQIQELERLGEEIGEDDPSRSAQCRRLLDEVNRGRLSIQVERIKCQSSEQGGAEHESN